MSCNSAIYAANTNATVAANGNIPFGSVIRRFGCNCQLEGGAITCCGRGYYEIDCSITMTPVGAGAVGVQLYADGVAVPGATASVTGAAATTENLSFKALVRQRCEGAVSLTLGLLSGAVATGVTVNNLGTVVKKI